MSRDALFCDLLYELMRCDKETLERVHWYLGKIRKAKQHS